MSDAIRRQFDFTVEESREAGDGLTLEGYAAVFNSPTEINSWEGKFSETIAPGAFKRTISHKTPIMQFDHGAHPMIGGIPIGAIRSLREDDRGLFVRARLSDNWLVQPVRDAIRDGGITGMSFRFTVRDDEWNDDMDVRTIREVELHELGPVVFPAYAATTVGVRSADDPISQLLNDRAVRDRLAQILTFGTSTIEDPAQEGTSEDRADEPITAPDDTLREFAADLADSVDRRLAVFLRSSLYE